MGLLEFYIGGDIQEAVSVTVDQDTGTDTEGQQTERRHLILFAFLSRMFIMAATSGTWLHTSELLPTEIRATGHGLANAMGRIGGITAPFIVSESTSLRTIGMVMCLVSTMTAVFSRCLPETAGMALGDFDASGTGIGTLQKRQSRSGMVHDHDSRQAHTDESLGPEETDDKSESSFELV